jgi:alkaline phosphatase D
MNRREFLKTLGGAGVAIPGLLTVSSCGPVVVTSNPSTGLSLGYICGDVTATSALIWLRAEAGSQVALQFGVDAGFAEFNSTKTFTVDPDADSTAQIPLDNLQPSTRYYYRGAVSDKLPGRIGSFLTAPRPDENAKVSFCFSGDTRESYQPFSVMQAVQTQRPDFFLHLGDTIYADRGGSAHRLEEFWQKYRANRNDPYQGNCFATTSVYALWDDHEVADNYVPGNPLAPIGQKAFLDYWPIRRSVAEPRRIYRSVRWGSAVELFLLDTRQYRDPKHATMLGAAQCEWLLDGLAQSTAAFKFVATSVPMSGGGSDRWDGYPKERAKILHFINEKKLRGVTFLSADLHCAAITKIPKSGGLLDITAGPLAAPLNRVTDGTAKRFEFYLAQNFNFAKITVDPEANANEALLQFIDQDNQVFYSRKLCA